MQTTFVLLAAVLALYLPAGLAQERNRDTAPARPERPPPDGRRYRPGSDRQKYSTEQAISDRAQLTTVAFDGLAFLAGDFGCNTLPPPGKLADFCGFHYLRDADQNALGHDTPLVPRAANSGTRSLPRHASGASTLGNRALTFQPAPRRHGDPTFAESTYPHIL